MRAPHGSCHAWPWLLERQNTLHVVAFDFFARDGIDDYRFDTEEWERCAARFCRCNTAQWGDDARVCFGLPVGVDKMCFFFSYDRVVPFPDLSSDWLPYRTQNSKVLQVVFDVMITCS